MYNVYVCHCVQCVRMSLCTMCMYSTTTLSPLNVASPLTPIQSIIVLYNLYIIIAASKACMQPQPPPSPMAPPQCPLALHAYTLPACVVNSQSSATLPFIPMTPYAQALDHTPAKSSCKIDTFAAEVVEVFQALVHCD